MEDDSARKATCWYELEDFIRLLVLYHIFMRIIVILCQHDTIDASVTLVATRPLPQSVFAPSSDAGQL
jgi:hypothetical protein